MIDRFVDKYSFLSNFFEVDILFDGLVYPSVEQAFQAAKTDDRAERFEIMSTTPSLAKKRGRKVQLRENWEEVKFAIMEMLVREKFSRGRLRKRLLDTKNHELIEGNLWGDTFWGMCNGVGDNNLGKILMKIRDDAISEEDEKGYLFL